MCGRYNIETNVIAWLQAFEILGEFERERDLRPRYNIAPTTTNPVIHAVDGRLVVSMMRWGFVPAWCKDAKPRMCNNARGETVSTNGYFKRAFSKQRCVVPASGFYEWHTGPDGKQPYNIRPRDSSPLLMAGIWDSWQGRGSAAILTVGPNATMEPIHDRMPVMLREAEMLDWITTDAPGAYLHPAPDDFLEAYPVSTAVNRVANDAPELIQPVELHQ